MLLLKPLVFGMKKLTEAAREVLNICLQKESPEVRAKVYEIVEVSELDPTDPMFLILALTGQMRVLLETAPNDLHKLLSEWQEKSDSSLESIQLAISQLQQLQSEQLQVMKRNLLEVSINYLGEIRQVGMSTTSAIAEANQETLNQASSTAHEAAKLKEEVAVLNSNIQRERQIWSNKMEALISKVSEPIENLSYTIQLADLVRRDLQKFQQQAIWMQVFRWFTPLTALALAAGIGFACGWWLMSMKYNDNTNTLGRRLAEWNLDRILKCQQQKKYQCPLWIVTPPEKR